MPPSATASERHTNKLDLYSEYRTEYVRPRKPTLVTVAPAKYLGIEGRGAPGGDAFNEALAALYNVSFTVKMARKRIGTEYGISKLEALWWTDHPAQEYASVPKDEWRWELLIRVPEYIAEHEVNAAITSLLEKKKPAAVGRVMLVVLDEGACVQLLHRGPYENEPLSLQRMLDYAKSQDLRFRGKHHEIYLTDARRVAPDRLRTILRMPVTPAGVGSRHPNSPNGKHHP